MMVRKIIFLKLVILSLSFNAGAQKKLYIFFDYDREAIEKIGFKPIIIDSTKLQDIVNETYQELYQNGYLAASMDIDQKKGDSITFQIRPGVKLKWAKLSPGNLPLELQHRINFRAKYFRQEPFNYRQISKIMTSVLENSENNGYPFAAIRLDSIRREENMLFASLNYHQGPLITFDTLEIVGDISTKSSFLQNYLRIFPGQPFEYKRIDEAPARLERLAFLDFKEESFLTFQNQQATYNLSLSSKKINLIDGIIGFLPNEAEGSRLLITGQFDLRLYNLFSSGKQLTFNWKRLQIESQSLQGEYRHPFLFKSPLSFSAGLNLLKEDSTFLNRIFVMDLSFDTGKHSRFHVFVNDKTANTLSNDLSTLQSGQVVDFDLTTYGGGIEWNSLNDGFDPTKGMKFTFSGQIGNKKIRKNVNLSDDFYQGIALTSLQYQLDLELDSYFPVAKNWVLNTHVTASKIFNDRLFRNDMYRVGGLNSLRGFNENFFFTTQYALLNFSWKYYFDQTSYFQLFFDQAIMEVPEANQLVTDYPSGVGAGLSFTTSSGIFSFIYALGRSQDQPFNFNLSKIHFGYSSRF